MLSPSACHRVRYVGVKVQVVLISSQVCCQREGPREKATRTRMRRSASGSTPGPSRRSLLLTAPGLSGGSARPFCHGLPRNTLPGHSPSHSHIVSLNMSVGHSLSLSHSQSIRSIISNYISFSDFTTDTSNCDEMILLISTFVVNKKSFLIK